MTTELTAREASAKYVVVVQLQIPKGYKQTDLGVIPNDWDVVPMGQVAKPFVGLTYSPLDVRDYGTLVLRSSNVQNGRLEFEDNVYVDMEIPQRAITRENDILICVRNGSRQLIGKCALVDSKTAGSAFGAFMSVLRSDSAKFLFFEFQSNILKRQIEEVMGATINQITNKDMAAFKVIWPPSKAEQEAIAEALSDADALIASLERLVAKQRSLKQGAMQDLLTGKKRLPGFGGKWEEKGFDKICWFQEGPGVRTSQFTSSGVKLLNGTNIYRGALNLETTNRYISEREANGAYAHFLADAGDIVIASSGITIERFHEKVAFVSKADLPFCMNTSTIRFKPFDEVLVPAFLYQYLIGEDFKRMIGGQATGSAQLNFGPSHVAKVTVLLPSREEQTAIATILSDMDAEIAALEARLAKAREVKQGMMQELLTGRIRLV